MIEKIKKQPKTIFITISIVILFGLIGGGYYYWWIGTPEYSISQIRKAIETQDKELGMKYVNFDALFEGFWTEMENEVEKEIIETAGLEWLNMMRELQMVENMKPTIKKELGEAVESWFLSPEDTKEKSTTTEEISDIWQEDLEIKKRGNSTYIETPDGIKMIFIKKEGERYWVITKLEGFAKRLFSTLENEKISPAKKKAKDSRIISAISQARTVMVFVYSREDSYNGFSCSYRDMKELCEEVKDNSPSGGEPIIKQSKEGACIYSELNSKKDYWYCADSNGRAGFIDSSNSEPAPGDSGFCDGKTFVCPFPEED